MTRLAALLLALTLAEANARDTEHRHVVALAEVSEQYEAR
jgi:hypothetical protein